MRTLLGIVVFLMVVAGVIGAGIVYLNRMQFNEPEILEAEVEDEFRDERELNRSIGDDPLASPSGELVIVVENEAGLSESVRLALYARVIEPFVDYYAGGEQGSLLTLIVNQNTQDNRAAYPYLASATFDSGVSIGFVVKNEGNTIAWWYPECMDVCALSPEFMDKYPEIVELVER